MRELAVRDFTMNACCKSCGRPFDKTAEKNGIILTTLTLWHSGKAVKLTIRESEIIKELINKYPSSVARMRVFGAVWGGASDVDDKILNVYLVKLRKKLATINLGVESIWGIGLRLVIK